MIFHQLGANYRGEVISWVKGSACFVLKFALPPFSPALPSGVQISKQNTHGTFDPKDTLRPVVQFHMNVPNKGANPAKIWVHKKW